MGNDTSIPRGETRLSSCGRFKVTVPRSTSSITDDGIGDDLVRKLRWRRAHKTVPDYLANQAADRIEALLRTLAEVRRVSNYNEAMAKVYEDQAADRDKRIGEAILLAEANRYRAPRLQQEKRWNEAIDLAVKHFRSALSNNLDGGGEVSGEGRALQLVALAAGAIARFNALSPDEQKAHRQAQRES